LFLIADLPDDIEAFLIENLFFHEKSERVLDMNEIVGVCHWQIDQNYDTWIEKSSENVTFVYVIIFGKRENERINQFYLSSASAPNILRLPEDNQSIRFSNSLTASLSRFWNS
jgi:hypothetical protein